MKVLEGQKVEYFEMIRRPGDPHNRERQLQGVATFLAFGSFSEDGGTSSTAIIKLPDGSIKNIYVEMVRFIERGNKCH